MKRREDESGKNRGGACRGSQLSLYGSKLLIDVSDCRRQESDQCSCLTTTKETNNNSKTFAEIIMIIIITNLTR